MKKKIMIIISVIIVVALVVVGVVCIKKSGSKKVNLPINVTFDELTPADEILEKITTDKSLWIDRLTGYYGMDKSKAENAANEPENWLGFNLFVNVENKNNEGITLTGFEIENNGENGIYISESLQASFITMEANSTNQLWFYVLVDSNEPSLEDVQKMLKDIKANVVYTEYTDDFDSDIPEEKLMRSKVNF